MATPPEIKISNLSGKFVMNKKLTDDLDKLLTVQGLSWLTRTAISYATVVLTIKSYKDDNSVVHVDIVSDASGLSKTQENRVLDWTDRDHSDRIFGKVRGRSRLITPTEEKPFEPVENYAFKEDEFLQGHTVDADGAKKVDYLEEESLHSYVKNQDEGYGWTAEQVWNFETIDGKRYHTRRVVGRDSKGENSVKVRLVYDYQGDADKEENEDDSLAYGDIRGD